MSAYIFRTGLIALAVALFGLASPARADWKRAESPNFIVYSQGSERDLREYVRNLEIYDLILRVRMGLPVLPAERKLPIYLVGGRSGLVQINPGTGQHVAGTYFPRRRGHFRRRDPGRGAGLSAARVFPSLQPATRRRLRLSCLVD
ncbi:MAG: hypothetical protein KL785_00480 [Brevundimonas sp.]|nr:hypothetical protein [Brevundimonas sp.]